MSLEQPCQLSNRVRNFSIGGGERGLNRGQSRRRHRFVAHESTDLAQDHQLSGRRVGGMENLLGSAAEQTHEEREGEQRGCRQRDGRALIPRDKGQRRQDRQDDRDDLRPAIAELRRGRGPVHECSRLYSGPDLGPGGGQLLSHVHPTPQLADRLLSVEHRLPITRGQEPFGERRLSRPGLGRIQELKHRPRAKQVEVLAEQVIGVSKRLARRADAGPGVAEARQPMLVPRDRSVDPVPRQQHPVVRDDQTDECGDRGGEPPGRHPGAVHRAPQEHPAGQEGGETDVADLVGLALERGRCAAPLGQPPFVRV